MLPKAHLTSYLRMFGSRWVITPLWLSESLRFFFNSSSVYSCHLFLMSSASVRSIPFLFFIVPTFAWNVPLVSLIFLKQSLVFPFLLFSSISLHWGRLSYLFSLCDWEQSSSLSSVCFFFICKMRIELIQVVCRSVRDLLRHISGTRLELSQLQCLPSCR